ncbi:MAG: hypothetical protein AUI14_09205, partial [Actinobacteria bacterium 13_2_20CM_2_71_6]
MLAAAGAMLAAALIVVIPNAFATPPTGFADTVVASATLPVGLDFTPDGRMLVTTKPGQLYAYSKTGVRTLALDASGFTCAGQPGQDERGMLSVAVDPAFATNNFIYVYYSSSASGSCLSRVSRFTLDVASHVATTSEKVLLNGIQGDGFHNAGDLVFGKDGLLYVAVGDGHCLEGCDPSNQAAQDLKNLNGKILRIAKDGTIPAGNPFSGTGTARCNTAPISSGKCQEIYAYGFRNPFRIAADPNASGTRIFVDDVGQNTTEEVDQLAAGANFGWPKCEGSCGTAGLTNPVFQYSDTTGGTRAAITGGAFVPNNAWDSAYNGSYLFSDYVKNNIYSITGTGTNFKTFNAGATAISMKFAPATAGGGSGSQQALYYTNLGAGQIHKVTFGTTAPFAAFSTSPGGTVSRCSTHASTAGAPPYTVTFDGSGSGDPNARPLTYHWDFGDGTPAVDTTTASTTHTYTTVGNFTPKLVVSNDNGMSSPAATGSVRTDDSLPAISITAPAPSDTFTVGNTYTPAGSATDGTGAAVPSSALTWQVWLFHINHVHPVLDPVAGNGSPSFVAPPAEQFSAIAGNSRLLVCLSATDAKGVTNTVEQDFNPTLVHLTMATNPAGQTVHIDEDDVDAGGNVTGPATVTSWAGYPLHLSALDGASQTFASWSDGGARSHVVTPTADTTYTATYQAGPPPSPIVNGGFESGDFTGWTRTGTTSIVTSPVHAGTHAVLLGSANPTNGDSKVAQTFTAPAGSTAVSFWYNENCPDAVTYDWATATLKDNTTGTTATVLGKTCTLNAGWKQVTGAVTPGHSYTLTLVSHDENSPGDATDTRYDDVSVDGSGVPGNDFSVSVAPASGSVTAGQSGSTTVGTAVTSGAAQSVSLSASGLPSGATASFNPASVTAGGSATLTVGTSASTPAGSYPITVTGTAASGTHTATYTLTVSTGSTGGAVVNGG